MPHGSTDEVLVSQLIISDGSGPFVILSRFHSKPYLASNALRIFQGTTGGTGFVAHLKVILHPPHCGLVHSPRAWAKSEDELVSR